MSIIQTIRDRGSWIMVSLLVLALISFIFMDSGNRDGLFSSSNDKTVGTVNGKSIKQSVFSERVEALSYAFAGQNVTKEQIEQEVWRMFVEEQTMKSEYAKFDEGLSGKALEDLALGKHGGQPDPFVTQFFKSGVFQGSGIVEEQQQMGGARINIAQAEQGLKQLRAAAKSINGGEQFKAPLKHYETLIAMSKLNYLKNKYQAINYFANYTPKWMAAKKMNEETQLTNISLVQVPYSDVTDTTSSDLKLSDKEINDYISKHPTMFKSVESRDIDYTTFDFKATSEDSAAIKSQIEAKRNSFESQNDSTMALFVNNSNSLIPYGEQYLRKSEIKIPDSLTNWTENAVFGPYVQDGNYVMAKIVKVKNYADSATARHILVKVADPQTRQQIRSDEEAKKIMDSVVAQYRSGVSFDSLAKKFSEDPGSKDSGGLYKNFPLNQMVPEFNEFAFSKNPGDTGVVKTVFGYHFIKAEGTKGAAKPVYKVAYLAKKIVPSGKTKDAVESIAAAFSTNNRTAKQFDEYIVKNPTQLKQNAVGVSRENPRIQGLEDDIKELLKWAYSAKVGEVSQPFAMEKLEKYVVAKLVAEQKGGIKTAADIRKDPSQISVINTLMNDKKYNYLVKKIGNPNSIEEAATRAGKQVVVKDSVSFSNPMIPAVGNEPKVIGYAFSSKATNLSGPIKGSIGLYYVKANTTAYSKPSTNNNIATMQKSMTQQMQSAPGSGPEAYKRKANIKDNRIEIGF